MVSEESPNLHNALGYKRFHYIESNSRNTSFTYICNISFLPNKVPTFQKINFTNLLNIFITFSNNENMLEPQPLLFSKGNSFSLLQNGKSMKINEVRADSALLNSTSMCVLLCRCLLIPMLIS